MSVARQFLPFAVKIASPKFRLFVMNLLPWKALHELRDLVNGLQTMANEVIDAKKSAVERGDAAVLEQMGEGKDIMSILCERTIF
jgi:hypothetical protein